MNSSFNPRTVLALVLFGALTFVALLWFIGQGDTGPGPDNGGAHARGHGITGYAGLVSMLQKQGYDVSLSRSPGRYDDESLLVLTPSQWADPEDIADIIEQRRYSGATLLILPKWISTPVPDTVKNAGKGWVQLQGAAAPAWANELAPAQMGDLQDGQLMTVKLAALAPGTTDWRGVGLAGRLPDRQRVLGLEAGAWTSLVRDSKGRDLVAYADDHGCYPVLDAASGLPAPEAECDGDKWNLTVVFEPDLFNNYGLADRNRAMLAARVIELAREGQDVPIVFDLTLNGFGANKNLLTLAFQPPFLAATLSLLLALVIVGWRAFGRFGPTLAEGRTIAFGKTRLATNAAGFIRRSGRLHLLGDPYAAMIARRMAGRLGLRRPDPEAIDAAIALRSPESPSYSHLARQLRAARGPSQTLRAAHALKSLERTL